MSSLEKRQANRRGSAHGSRKCSNGISNTPSVGSFMDDTDREVSSLTDRAFRSLCIGEDAIYNDLEVSSPADQHKACAEKALQKKDLRMASQTFSSHGIQFEETERKLEVGSTFQHSGVDTAQERVLRDESLSYISNGCMEAMWQQKRSASRVSSLIKAFSSGECYTDSGAPDTVKDKYQDLNNRSWDKSALLSMQRELTEFSSGCCPNLKSGPLQSHGNHFHAVSWMNTTTSSKTNFKALNTNNLFCHSEFSPFQLWKDYNRFPFKTGEPPGFVSGFSRWYDSPFYKELTTTNRITSSPAEGRQFTQRKIEDVAASHCSRSTVIQKALAIEKRCESEMASNCPPWKNNNFVKNKLPSNRPSTVSPSNEKVHRPDSSLLYHSRQAYEVQHKVGKVGSADMSSRTTPFNISQLLTPVIPGRQETDTSEILQFARTPLLSECDADLKAQSDVKQSRDSYKSKASSLLFNLKDNRKRVKSTYSPTKFKCFEISDRNKQPSKLEGHESRLSETSGSIVPIQEHATIPAARQLCNQPNYELPLLQTAEHQQNADKPHNNIALVSPYGTTNSNIPYLSPQNKHPDLLTNRESDNNRVLRKSGRGNSGERPVGYINDSTRIFGTTKPETENILSKAQLPAHLSEDMPAKPTFCRREDSAHQNIEMETNFVRTPTSSQYINNQVTDKNLSWKRAEPVNMSTKEMVNNEIKDPLHYKGEIASLIEMDKQRKATAKQYLPSANEGFFMSKDTCMNKVNGNGNDSWVSKYKQIQDTKSSFQTGYPDQSIQNKLVQDYQKTSQHLDNCQQNSLQKMAVTQREIGGTKITTHENTEVCFPRKFKYSASDMDSAKNYSQRPQFLQSEEKSRNNEGSVAYQPYKYESNKQWHIATTENRHSMGEECMSRRHQQSEIKAEQRDEENYIHSLSRISYIPQQSTAYSVIASQRHWITEDTAKTEELKPNNQIHHKQTDMNTDLNNPNIQRTLQNKNTLQTRGDKFNINDILSVRDNEHARRIRENKYSFNGQVGDPTKVENLTSSVTSDEAEDMAAKKVRSRAKHDGNSSIKTHECRHENTNVLYGHVRNEAHIPNDMKERPEKDIFPINENNKFTLRALSYKEKGQTKQEILTSKLKAHAQKEISAIKEKGLTKHAITPRNPIKQSTSASNDKEQIMQEIRSPQKEITAEKLNHLFQDITYSSVSLYKEQRNHSRTEPKDESLTEKEELLAEELSLETDKVTDKEQIQIQMINSQEITDVDKKHYEVQKVVEKNVQQSNMQYKEDQIGKPSKDYEKEKFTNHSGTARETVSATCFSDSEESVVKKEDNTSLNLSTTYKENSTAKHEELAKTPTNNFKLFDVLGNAVTLKSSVNRAKEQLSDDTTTEPPADTNTVFLKCHELVEPTKSENDTRKESPFKARELEVNTRQDKTPLGWMKVTAVEKTVEFTETANRETVNTEQERNHLQNKAAENNTLISVTSPKTSFQYSQQNTETQEKKTWPENQDIQEDAVLRTKTNNDSFNQQNHITVDDDDTLKSSQNLNASNELGNHLSLGLNKPVSMESDSLEKNNYSLEQETNIKMLQCENREIQETMCHSKIEQQEGSERALDTENHNQKAEEFQKHIESLPTENKLSADDVQTSNCNSSTSPCNKHEKSKDCLPNITITSTDQQLSSHPAEDQSVDDTNPVPESHIIHISSKEDSSPINEPVIYSICVSSTTEDVPEEEPMIFRISVSSLSDALKIPAPKKQEKSSKQLSVAQEEKDNKETSDNTNKEGDFLECKENSKEVKLGLNNDTAKEETALKNYDSSASKDKLDYYRSTEKNNISSSYESLLAKCGLPERDTIHLEPDQKEQGEDPKNIKAKNTTTNNPMNDVHVPVKNLTSANSTRNSPAFKKSNSPKESPKVLRHSEKTHEQHVTFSEHGHQISSDIVFSNRNHNQDVPTTQELLMSKVVPICKNAVDNQSGEQIKDNGNVQLKENKQVRQKVQTNETEQKENRGEVINKTTEMVQVKCETDSKITAKFNIADNSNVSSNYSSNELPQTSSTISTNDQIRIENQNTELSLTQNSQNVIDRKGDIKGPTLTYRTPMECKGNSFIQEKLKKEHLQTGDNKAIQTNDKMLVGNEVNVSQVIDSQNKISNFSNEQTRENPKVNRNLIKYAMSYGQDSSQEDKYVHQNNIKSRIQEDAVRTRGALPASNVKENAQNTTPEKVTETGINSSAPGMTNDGLEKAEIEKWKKELTQKEREIKRNEVTLLNKDPKTVSSIIKADEKDAECKFSKEEKKLNEGKAQTQAKKDIRFGQLVIDNTNKSAGEIEIKAETRAFIESIDTIGCDIESSRKVLREKPGQPRYVNNPQKNSLLERKEKTYDGTNTVKTYPQSEYPDTVLTKQEPIFTKSEFTQEDKKTTRPEISALADYARLRVISAEDDTNTEKDILQKMNTSQKYNLSAGESQKVNLSMSVDDTEQNKQLSVNKKSENLNTPMTHLQAQQQQTDKTEDEILAGQQPKVGSLAKSSGISVYTIENTESTKEKTINHMQSNARQSLTAKDNRYSRSLEVQNSHANSLFVRTQIENNYDTKPNQSVNANIVERKIYPPIKNAQCVTPVSIKTERNNANSPTNEDIKANETSEELQYYIVNGMESETKPKNTFEPPLLNHNISSKKDSNETPVTPATAPRSNTSSPAMGKPIMFRVKDNTGKTSSVTKTVRPRFHRSFSEEFRVGTPADSCFGPEKDKMEYDQLNDRKESGNVPGLSEQSLPSHRFPNAKEIQTRNVLLSPGFTALKHPRSYSRRSHMAEGNESQPEDEQSLVDDSSLMTNSIHLDTEHHRHTYARPESSCHERPESACYERPESACYERPESACYERPESACYERPESACSDMRSTSKPPAVPPKTEKALRRAKRLTSRRIRKVEDKMASDTPVPAECKSIRTVSSLPASPMVQVSTTQSVQASPLVAQYHVAPPASSIVAHSFPVTQRKLLQDPNSGQVFMVDMPVHVKTKTFFDPATGKYLQLNVQQRAQSTLSQPASLEMLRHPYVLYPGFLPMPVSVSSVPSVRSSSQMSAPATLTEDSNQPKARQELGKHEISKPEHHRNVQQHNRAVYRTPGQIGREILHSENVRMTPRQTHIITMSELEDFAVENRLTNVQINECISTFVNKRIL
ncbi:hypothetical protein Baya_2127 [Bagarius yarrelli]|uniref:DUF4585 domain-containing protein n=1 Tax=Bagarius yarrelli TaxID=175774 RepID=A0A556TN24_BAGYA|nr:hypothetical protein Baya_2127 [Bagarius yarrelli]